MDLARGHEMVEADQRGFKDNLKVLMSRVRTATGSRRPARSRLRVPLSGLTPEIVQRFAPDHCKVTCRVGEGTWHSWWVGPYAHLKNRHRSWELHGYDAAGISLLREVWSQYTRDTGIACPYGDF